MDVQFRATEFKIADSNNADGHGVQLPFQSQNISINLQTRLNPGPSQVTLSLDDEKYQISENEQSIFVTRWNQSISCQHRFEDTNHTQTIVFTIPNVTRDTRARAAIRAKEVQS